MSKKFQPRVSVAHSNIPVTLGYIGGIFTILMSLLSISLTIKNPDTTILILSVIGLISGSMVTYGTFMLNLEGKFKTGSLLMIIFSAVGLISLQGLIIGPILSLAAGILTHVRKMI